MVIINTNTEKFVVVQSNELIEATYSPALTARAHKVSRLIFSLISPSDTDLKLYSISIETLKRFLGYNEEGVYGRFQQDLRDIAERLNKEPIVIKSEGKITTAYLIAAYQLDWKQGVVTFEIPQLLKPFLIELKRNFTKYPLLYIPKLRSSYAIRLYELLYQYKNIGHRTFDLEDLQKKVGSDYKLYGDFKRKVLAISARDMAENADITFDYKEIKDGKKVTGLRFTILTNENVARKPNAAPAEQPVLAFLKTGNSPTDPEHEPMPADLQKPYLEAGIVEPVLENSWRLGFSLIDDAQKRSVAELRCKTVEVFFREKLALLQNLKNTATANPAGFLIRALHEDWVSPAATKKETDRKTAAKKTSIHDRLREIAQFREQLKIQKDQTKNRIYSQLLPDPGLWEKAFEQAKNGVGEGLRAGYFPENRSPEQIFGDGGLAKNLIALQIEALRPDLFLEINENYRARVGDLDAEERGLRAGK